MSHKHLHELLTEDQEPFLLKNYIADRRYHLKSNPQTTALTPTKPKPVTQFKSARNFCVNHVCLFSFHDSPDVTRSPFLDFPSPAIKTPYCKRNNRIFRNVGFGLLGSFVKRLKDRKIRTEISMLSSPANRNLEMGVAGSSADWSENSSDFENSCSSSSVNGSVAVEKCFCSSPLSPFRFSLERSYSSGRRTPDFRSPEISPTHHPQQGKRLHYDVDKSQEEEDKEQCSPVSVLDPLFEDDSEEHDTLDEDGYDLERAYTNVQRAKHKLLQKLQRFENLEKLDPTQLEQHMYEQGGDPLDKEAVTNEVFLKETSTNLDVVEIPTHMKNLVSDLIVEESKNEVGRDVVVRRVVCRLELWKMVESNTIDMMVELDFRSENSSGWRRYDDEKIRETGIDIEVAIFGGLTEELAQELVC